jgi:hypothetical protein
MPEKLGDSFKKTDMVTPLNAPPQKPDPGPPILNNPLIKPDDPLDFMGPVTQKGK